MVVGSLVSPAWAQGPALDFLTISFPGEPDTPCLSDRCPGTFAGSINNAGQIVGRVTFQNEHVFVHGLWRTHGFVDDHGSFTILDACPACGSDSISSTFPRGINNRGDVVGTYFTNSALASRGFLWRDGVFTAVAVPSALATSPDAVNDGGEIVGSYEALDGTHAFLFSGGQFTTIDPPGAAGAIATGINNVGQIVGEYVPAGNPGPPKSRGFLYQDGVFTDIGLPPTAESIHVFGISDTGDVVGYYPGAHGFLYRGGIFYTIDVPYRDSPVSYAAGVNSSGQIVGDFTVSGSRHVYLANPSPAGLTRVNDSVTFDPIRSTYSMAGSCNLGPDHSTGELFTFAARLTALGDTTLSDAFVQIATLTPDRLVAEVGGEGAFTPVPWIGQYADGVATPGESVDVTFGVCLPNRDPFELTVNVWGRKP